MKIAIIGGGFTGLTCALHLLKNGFQVDLFEKGKTLGGLAKGIQNKKWKWSLEDFYHHAFTSDRDILSLAKDVDVKILIKNPVTTGLINKKELRLDSPISVLKFSELSILGRLRMGFGLAVLKIIPNGLFLEKYRVVDVLPRLIGKEGFEKIWEKLLRAKFGGEAGKVNMAWFWARVAKRTKNLAYFEGGFQNLADKVGEKIVKLGGKILTESKIREIEKKENGKWTVGGEEYDGVVMTTPAPITESLLGNKVVSFPKISYLWGQTLVLELNKKLINSYWLNVLENNWPFLVAVEHTNLIDKKYYGDTRLVYLGNYLPEGNKQLQMTKEQLTNMYLPYLRKINPHFRKKWIKESFVFRAPFAQPVFPVNYGRSIPKMKIDTGLYLGNMSMVYPYDRGTNYAVKMGNDIAKQIIMDLK